MVVVYSWTHDGSVPCILFWSCRISDAQPEVVISITVLHQPKRNLNYLETFSGNGQNLGQTTLEQHIHKL